jgi:thymidylate synthase (FAD)
MPPTENPTPLVRLIWATPNGEDLLTYIAKVSNPAKQDEPAPRLIRYLMEHGHWSPFEMVNVCFEVNTTRDIGRQFLRHWTMRPQEFSQRYQDVTLLGEPVFREARTQHPTNRQASIPSNDLELQTWWDQAQGRVWGLAVETYRQALEKGIAKEVARVVMPEGMTRSKLYFNAPLRTILHMVPVRSKAHGAQDEAVEIAKAIAGLVKDEFPDTFAAWKEFVLKGVDVE